MELDRSAGQYTKLEQMNTYGNISITMLLNLTMGKRYEI